MTRGLRLLVIGKQGSGKGTLCEQFSRHFSIPHISTGDAFRSAVEQGSAVGLAAKEYLDAGRLVPDDLVIRVVRELYVNESLADRGFLFDGFPRTMHQADLLDEMLAPESYDAVINLEVSTEVVVARLTSRRVCTNPECATIYSLSSPPKTKWICDRCGSEVRQRDDDREEVILQRLSDYELLTTPLLARYEATGKLITIDASRTPDEVFASALGELVSRSITLDQRS